MLSVVVFLCIIVYFHSDVVNGCYIHGTDSGVCSEDGLDKVYRDQHLQFCADKINYPVCLPKIQTLPPSRMHESGRWSNYTIETKDTWVKDQYTKFVKERIDLEMNRTLKKARKNEYGEPHRITSRFHRKKDCLNAFKNYFCWVNFPRCDPDRDLSFPTCRSACENFFKACNYDRDLWRCGKSMYFNGYEPEAPITDSVTGEVTYLREYFPGQPFRENKYTTGGSELPICTPAITGSAPQGAPVLSRWISLSVVVLVSAVLRFWY